MNNDLTSAIVRSSKAYASPIAAAYASGNRAFHIIISRPGDPGVFNRDTGRWTNRTTITVYDGPARIWADPGSTLRQEGDEQIPYNDLRVSIDQDLAHIPQVDDDVLVVSDSQSQSALLADRVFEITGVEAGGHMQSGIVFTMTGAAPSRHNA